MARRRKTKDEREAERWAAENQAWNWFRPKMAALASYDEALALIEQMPRPDSPGRRYYTSLDFFVKTFNVPGGSSYEERLLYLQFIQRLVAAGKLNPEVGQEVEAKLRRAMGE